MIPADKQADLRERFNPDGSTLRASQLRMLEILKFIDQVCAENAIHYWLSSGTCLGAVRHGGFIPWDDDVDIEMLEPDFRRLRSAWLALDNPPFVWQDIHTDPAYSSPNPKIRDLASEVEENDPYGWKYKYRGLFVDVFHLRPSSSRWFDKGINLYQLHIIRPLSAIQSSAVNKLLMRPAVWFFNSIVAPITNLVQRINPQGKLRHAPGSLFTLARKSADVAKTVRVPFEGVMLPIPEGYDSYLRDLYGDYNALPSEFHIHSTRVRFLNQSSE